MSGSAYFVYVFTFLVCGCVCVCIFCAYFSCVRLLSCMYACMIALRICVIVLPVCVAVDVRMSMSAFLVCIHLSCPRVSPICFCVSDHFSCRVYFACVYFYLLSTLLYLFLNNHVLSSIMGLHSFPFLI